jgi:hypothetical protein
MEMIVPKQPALQVKWTFQMSARIVQLHVVSALLIRQLVHLVLEVTL